MNFEKSKFTKANNIIFNKSHEQIGEKIKSINHKWIELLYLKKLIQKVKYVLRPTKKTYTTGFIQIIQSISFELNYSVPNIHRTASYNTKIRINIQFRVRFKSLNVRKRDPHSRSHFFRDRSVLYFSNIRTVTKSKSNTYSDYYSDTLFQLFFPTQRKLAFLQTPQHQMREFTKALNKERDLFWPAGAFTCPEGSKYG